MQKIIYEWIQNLSVYLILMMAIMQLISNESYRKYFHFFAGLVLIMLIMTPLLRLTDLEQTFYTIYHSVEYRQETDTLKEYETYLEDVSTLWEEGP